MKKILITLLILLTLNIAKAQYTFSWVYSGNVPVLIATPVGYNSSKAYPLIIGFHGKGESGNAKYDTARIWLNGIPKLLKGGWIPPLNAQVNLPYIFAFPQDNFGATPGVYVPNILNLIESKFNIDSMRRYLTGYSFGGQSVNDVIANVSAVHTAKFAAAVALSPAAAYSHGEYVRAANMLVYETFGTGALDAGYKPNATNQYNTIGTANSVLYSAAGIGHDGDFNKVYDGTYKLNGLTVWQIFDSRVKGGVYVKPNIAPTVRSFKTQYTFPSTSISTTIDATDSDGVIKSYQWIKPKTGVTNVKDSTAKTTEISAMVPGEYNFDIIVTDDKGAKGYGAITLTVLEEPTVQLGEFNFNGCVFKFYGKKSNPKSGTYIIQ